MKRLQSSVPMMVLHPGLAPTGMFFLTGTLGTVASQHSRHQCAACLRDAGLPVLARQGLQPQLRHLLHYHCGVRVFKTRQLMLDMQAMSRPRVAPEPSPTHLQALS